MGLESLTSASYITSLTANWPTAGEPKSQGDDHIRLIKSVLQNTFPDANRAWRIPSVRSTSAAIVLDPKTDQNNFISVTTTTTNVTITLPGGLTTSEAGWACEIVKITADANAVIVSPPSGSILSQVGATATIRVGAFAVPARFVWSGSVWICVKSGELVGTTVSWDGATIPVGYLLLNGQVVSATGANPFAELVAAYGGTTLRDKRGRVEIAAGTGAGLTARTLGTNYGAETMTLATTNLPAYTPGVSLSGGVGAVTFGAGSITSSLVRGVAGTGNLSGAGPFAAADASITLNQAASTLALSVTPQGGAATAFGLLQPSIGTQLLIRAC